MTNLVSDHGVMERISKVIVMYKAIIEIITTYIGSRLQRVP